MDKVFCHFVFEYRRLSLAGWFKVFRVSLWEIRVSFPCRQFSVSDLTSSASLILRTIAIHCMVSSCVSPNTDECFCALQKSLNSISANGGGIPPALFNSANTILNWCSVSRHTSSSWLSLRASRLHSQMGVCVHCTCRSFVSVAISLFDLTSRWGIEQICFRLSPMPLLSRRPCRISLFPFINISDTIFSTFECLL